jgi:Sulfotransferase family
MGRANLPRHNKETRFFDTHYAKGLKWYATQFDRSAPTLPVGEICPTYFYSEQARKRIAELIPKVKIICTFRDPVERVFSLYRIKRVYGATRWSLDEALSRDPELLESSRYAFHLSEWQALFGRENVLIAIYDDLVCNPQAYLSRIVDFIGIPPFPLKHWQVRRVNSSERLAEPLSRHWTHFASNVAEWFKAHRFGALVTAVKKSVVRGMFLGGGADIPSLDAPTAARLRELFRPEVEQLEAMLDRDLSRWKSQ